MAGVMTEAIAGVAAAVAGEIETCGDRTVVSWRDVRTHRYRAAAARRTFRSYEDFVFQALVARVVPAVVLGRGRGFASRRAAVAAARKVVLE